MTASDLAWLVRTCAVLGIPRRGWARVSWLRVAAETLAVETEVERIRTERDACRELAVREACGTVGVAESTHYRRLERALRDAMDPDREPIPHKMWGDRGGGGS